MFSGNAFQKPEIRPTEIKAAMRFWWRAMNAHLTLEEMKQEEAYIFGGRYKVNEHGKVVEKHRRAGFTIDIDTPIVDNANIGKNLGEYLNIPFRRNGKRKVFAPDNETKGLSYLLYSTFMLNDKPFIKPDYLFNVNILFREKSIWQGVHDAILALQIFGGIGARSRRGAGVFRVDKTIGNHFLPESVKLPIDSIEELKASIEYLSSKLLYWKTADFSRMKDSVVFLFDRHNNWEDALNEIGLIFEGYRTKNKHRVGETPEFGFPIVHRRNNKVFKAGKLKNGKWVFLDRRSSPIIIKVVKVKDEYIPVLLHLAGSLLPNGFSICDQYGGNAFNPKGSIIDEFLSLSEFNNATRIQL